MFDEIARLRRERDELRAFRETVLAHLDGAGVPDVGIGGRLDLVLDAWLAVQRLIEGYERGAG